MDVVFGFLRREWRRGRNIVGKEWGLHTSFVCSENVLLFKVTSEYLTNN